MRHGAQVPRRILVASAVGSVIEWYDFAVFGAFATVLARVFFPDDAEMKGVLLTFAVFGVGFIARPLGAVVFGSFGDRFGRRRTLLIAIVAIAIPTALLAILPTPARIGQWAAILLVSLRFLQGISVGGEIGGALAFIGEHAPADREARTLNWVETATTAGLLLGSLVAFAVSALLTENQLDAWGWRVAFALTLPLLAIGYAIRRSVPESPEFEAAQEAGRVVTDPLRTLLRTQRATLTRALLLAGAGYALFYFLATFIPAFLQMHSRLAFSTALLLASVNIVVVIIGFRIGAELSDRWGRRRSLVLGSALMLAAAYPSWVLLASGSTIFAAIGGMLYALPLGIFALPELTIAVRSFPTELRYTGYSVAGNVAGAVVGGTVAFAATGLMMITGSAAAPVAIVVAAAGVALAVSRLVPPDPR